MLAVTTAITARLPLKMRLSTNRNCLDKCAPAEHLLHQIIALGLAFDGVVVSGIVSYGHVAADFFAGLASTYAAAAREVLPRRDSSSAQVFECIVPLPGMHPPHGRFLRGDFVNTARRAAACFTRCFRLLAERLELACPAARVFEQTIYDTMAAQRRGQFGAELLHIPKFVELLPAHAPRLNRAQHSQTEFLVAAYVLNYLRLPCTATHIIAAVELGAQHGRADVAVRLPDGRMLFIEWDSQGYHKQSRVPADVSKTRLLLARVDDKGRSPTVIRLREHRAAVMPPVLGADIVSVPAGRSLLGERVLEVLAPLLAGLSSTLEARPAGYAGPPSQLVAAYKAAWALIDPYGEKSAERTGRNMALSLCRARAKASAQGAHRGGRGGCGCGDRAELRGILATGAAGLAAAPLACVAITGTDAIAIAAATLPPSLPPPSASSPSTSPRRLGPKASFLSVQSIFS